MKFHRIEQRVRDADLFVTHGADPSQSQNMRNLWMDGLFASIADAFTLTYITLYALAFGATNAQIGSLSSVSSLFSMLAPIPGAQLTERWGDRRRVVVSIWTAARALFFLMAVLPWFLSGDAAIYAIIAVWALRAGLANLAHPAWVSLAGDVIPGDRRGRFLASRNVSMALASMLFVPLAGQIIEWGGDPGGYQWAFAISAAFGFVALFYYRQIRDPGASAARPARPKLAPAAFMRTLFDSRTFLLYTLISMVWNFSMQVGGPFFNVFQVKELGTTPAMMGVLSMTMDIARIGGQWFWGRIVDRRGSYWVFAACALFIPALPFAWFLLTAPWQAVFIRIPSGFLWAGFNLASFNLLLELPDASRRTQATAGYTTLVGLANIAGPLVGGYVVDRWGYFWDFGLSGVGRLVGALLFIWLLQPFKRARGLAALAGGRRTPGPLS